MANVITYGVTLDASGAISGFKRLDAAIDENARKVTDMEKRASRLGTAIGGAIVAGAAIAAAGLQKMVRETSEAQRVQSQLAAGLRSTAHASRQTVESLNAHADALSKVSTFSDEAIGSAQSILLTFTKLSGETFPRATTALVDMATRMGGDLSGAAVQLGKALNDPVQGITALTRVGVSFSDAQKAVIRDLTETNRLAEAQAMILAELETEFGGSAAAAANTLGGALTRLSNAWGNLFELSEGGSSRMVRAINAITDAIPRLHQSLGAVINSRTNGLAGLLSRWWTAPTEADASALPAFGQGQAAAITITAIQTESDKRRQAWIEARAQAKEREGWETAAIARAVALAEARFAAERGGGPARPGAGTTALGWDERLRGIAEGRGVTSLPPSLRVGPGLSTEQGASLVAAQAANQRAADLERMNAEIAENYRENMQRAVGGIVADLLSGGKLAIADVWSTFRRIGAQAIGETVSSALARAMGGAAGGGLGGLLSNPLAIALGVGGVLIGALRGRGGGPSYRANPTPTYDANGMDARQVAAREALAAANGGGRTSRVGSVAGVLTEHTATRLFGTFEAMRRSLGVIEANTTAMVATGAAGATGSVGAMNRALGMNSQLLRLQSGVAVVA